MNGIDLMLKRRFEEQSATSESVLAPVLAQVQQMALQIQTSLQSGSHNQLANSSSQLVSTSSGAIPLHSVGGHFSRLPPAYVVPSYTVAVHWNLWHFGNQTEGIVAHKLVNIRHDISGANNKTRFCRISKVVQRLLSIICEQSFPFVDTSRKTITAENSESAYRHSMSALVATLYGTSLHARAYSDVNINTVYNRMCEYDKRSTAV